MMESSYREPLPRCGHAAVGIGDKLVVWRGSGDYIVLKTTALEIFDVTSAEWEQPQHLHGCDMLGGLHGMAVTSDGETAYCCGGRTGSHPNFTYHNTLFRVTLSQQLCQELKPTSPFHTAPKKSSGSGLVQFGDKLVLCGGRTDQGRSNDLHVFDLKKSECGLCGTCTRELASECLGELHLSPLLTLVGGGL